MLFNKKHLVLIALFFISGMLYAAEITPPRDQEDPAPLSMTTVQEGGTTFSGFNHAMFQFNDWLDQMILKPVASFYNKLVPRPLHKGVTNFFNNIDNIPTVFNDILQLHLYHLLSDSWRLFINSTVGVFGFFDVASHMGLKAHHEDFGLTLARWGYKNSNYLVVPLFGPGTIRDIIGWPIDYFFFSVYPHIHDTKVRYGFYSLGVVDRRSNMLQYQDVLEQVAVDKYGFVRTAYLQHRQHQIQDNEQSGDSVAEENE